MKTLLIGASLNPARYSHICLHELARNSIETTAIGLREGSVAGIAIQTGFPELSGIHTVTLYIGPHNQGPYYNYILSLNPQRVIFNPGTENPEFESLLEQQGIGVLSACTIVMLHSGMFMRN